jgi:hypothetical protein
MFLHAILVLSNGRLPANLKFTYNNRDLEIVPNFSYLGIAFSKSGSFNAAKKDLVNKGMKAMYEVLKKGRLHNLSIQCSFDSDIITVSSAYTSTKSFKYTSSSISKSSVIDVRPTLKKPLIRYGGMVYGVNYF